MSDKKTDLKKLITEANLDGGTDTAALVLKLWEGFQAFAGNKEIDNSTYFAGTTAFGINAARIATTDRDKIPTVVACAEMAGIHALYLSAEAGEGSITPTTFKRAWKLVKEKQLELQRRSSRPIHGDLELCKDVTE